MIIEYTNIRSVRPSRPLERPALIVSVLLFLVIPLSVAIASFFSVSPTGTLLSPLPQSVISADSAPIPANEPLLPIVASDNSSSVSATTVATQSNSSDHSIVIPAGKTETKIENSNIDSNTQILIIPQEKDSSVYYVKSKGDGFFVLSADSPANTDRSVDYQLISL